MSRQYGRWSVLCLLLVGLAGCGGMGERLVTIKGRLVEGGQPVRFEGQEYQVGVARVEVTFWPVDSAGKMVAGGQSWSTSVQPDGTFVMDGAGKGIPAGRYKVGLRHTGAQQQYDPRDPSMKEHGGDLFQGRFTMDKTPFVFDLNTNQEVTLDIGQGNPGS